MKKVISIVLVLTMVLGLLPGVFAADRERPEADRPAEGAGFVGFHGVEPTVLDTENRPDPDTEMTIVVVLDESMIPDDGRPTRMASIHMKAQQAAVQKTISEEVMDGSPVEVRNSFHTLTNGFSMRATYGQLQEIRNLDGVVSAYEAPRFNLLPAMKTSNEMVGGGSYNETGYTGAGTVVAILDTGVDLHHEVFADAPEDPRLTREAVAKILEENDMHCETIVPGVGADTLYYNAKIPFQFDYGEQDADGNPPESGGEHGTHVAGTVAGNSGVQDRFSGVAPEAQIINMKVFQKGGGASFDDVIAALEDCVMLKVDAANLSLGSDCGFIDYESPDEWTANLLNVFERVGESGVCLSVAAGNAYSAAYKNNYGGRALASNPDYGNASMPSTLNECLSIAATENAGMTGPYITVNGRNIAYYDGYDAATQEVTNDYVFRTIANKGTLTYVPVPGAGREEDYAGLDVSGKIALVCRGDITYEEKAGAAAKAGAMGMVVYNNISGMVLMSITKWQIPIAFVSKQDGEYMLNQDRKELVISTADGLVPSPVAGMCDFSSWGATSELTLKPELTAPGGNIYSSIPGNKYELMSGTSMATPHVAGGMAIIRKAMAERYPDLTPGQIKDRVDTVLMSTAQILYDENETPVSPRKQGAGMMDINNAILSRAYLTVEGMERPKMELGDDAERTGVYNLSVTVHNDSDETRYYNVSPIVLTDRTTEEDGHVLMTETDTPLAHSFTSNFKDNLVTVEPGKTADVTVTVTLTDPETTLKDFPNGAFVEGWLCLDQADAEGKPLAEGRDLNAPFLAFYDDWTKAPMIDSAYWWDELKDEKTDAQVWPNEALVASMENTYHTFLGANNYNFDVPYLADRNAISPNEDDFMDCLGYVHTGLLRSARHFIYTITGEDGTEYYRNDVEYNSKSVYHNELYSVAPAGAVREWGDAIEPWYGTDEKGMALPSGTKATVTVTASPVYNAHESHNVRDSWSFPITIDTEAPEVLSMDVREAEGRYYADISVTDNEYVAAVVLADARYDKEYAVYGIGEMKPGQTTNLKDIDITGLGETIGLVVHDYAGNSKTYYLHAHGNSDDYADVKVTDDMVLYYEGFNDAWLPEGWSQSEKKSAKTWYRDEDNWAVVDFDEEFEQNEWLYTPAYDLSGLSTQTHIIFDFNTSYTWCVQYKHFNAEVMISADDGKTWEPIWSLRDCGLFTDWETTQARVTIPDDYQGLKNVRFAMVYTNDKNGAQFAFDNFVIYKDKAENYAAVTATAGEHGTMQPAGRVLVRKGNSRTFTAVPDEGYQVENLKVDGKDLGPISRYVFEKVGVDHTVEAAFCKATEKDTFSVEAVSGEGGTITPAGKLEVEAGADQIFKLEPREGYRLAAIRVNGHDMGRNSVFTLTNVQENYYVEAEFEKIPAKPEVLFQQDFEGDRFAPEGWSVQGTENTWIRKSYWYLKTMNAYVSCAEGQAQDEWLIAPEVNLKDASETLLEFDYAYPHYPMKLGNFTFRLMASLDGGETWTEVWNAKDTLPASVDGPVVTNRAFIELPETLCQPGVTFAWNFARPASSDSGIAAIDNVKLQAAGVDTHMEGSVQIRAEAGEGGRIDPSGRVYVTENEDKTFTITPDSGFVIADVLVDGISAGPVSEYTFRNLTKDHTIRAEFKLKPLEDGKIFENDFEDEDFPSRGWTVKSESKSRNHWEKGTLSQLNKTSAAVVTNDYVDWSSAPAQDEWLISPKVNLTDKNTVLTFDAKVGRYETQQGYMNLEVLITSDGETWDPIWNAKDGIQAEGGMFMGGEITVEIPALYRSDANQIAFRYTKQAGAEGDKAAVDNVVLKELPCTHEHTELRNAKDATCTEEGYTGDLVCTDCGKVIKEGTVIPALGHKWGRASYEWSEDLSSCTAVRVCENDNSHRETVSAKVTSKVTKEAEVGVKGEMTYTAEFTEDWAETQTRKTEIPALEIDSSKLFTDVHKDDWFYEAINYAVGHKLFNGMGNNEFRPDTAMTRAMLVTVLWRQEGEPAEGKNIFTDVEEDQWYTGAVKWAAHNGIVNGDTKTTFSPDDDLTREQMAAILYRYAGYLEIKTDRRADLKDFPDGSKVMEYAEKPMQWAVAEKLIGGSKHEDEKLYLDPQGDATRAQVATILMRFIEKFIAE